MSFKSWIAKKALTGKLPNWVYRLAGKKIAKKIGLEDSMSKETNAGTVAPKPWYLSKAKLAAIVTVVVSAVGPISTAFGKPITIPAWVIEVLIGLGIYGIRDSIKN